MCCLLNNFQELAANTVSETALCLNFASSIFLFQLEPIDHSAKSQAVQPAHLRCPAKRLIDSTNRLARR